MASSFDVARVLAGGAFLVAVGFVACGRSDEASPASDAGASEAATPTACPACVTDDDCQGMSCVQLGADSFCAPRCEGGCATDRTCTTASSIAGDQVDVCVPSSGACAAPADDDAAAPPGACPGLAAPTVAAPCASCAGRAGCQANGCFGGWWCNLASTKCQPPPASCGGAGGLDGGAPVTGTVGPSGGRVSRLFFSVVGDTRPPTPNDTAGYPTAIVTQIFEHVEALSPRPSFVVATGDYQFSTNGSVQASAQLDLYLAARAHFSGPLFPAMGNHECTGATASNCGVGATDGVTTQLDAFTTKLLAPIQQTSPWYAVEVDGADGSWTSKLVFVAANAWSTDQATWLEATLAKPTTYTFVVRHESKAANEAPGVTPSEDIMAKHPYTLAIVGHTHTYEHRAGSREVIVGNGGAPLTGNKNYGFAVVQQRADGAIQVDMIDATTGAPDSAFRFAVRPDGTATN